MWTLSTTIRDPVQFYNVNVFNDTFKRISAAENICDELNFIHLWAWEEIEWNIKL